MIAAGTGLIELVDGNFIPAGGLTLVDMMKVAIPIQILVDEMITQMIMDTLAAVMAAEAAAAGSPYIDDVPVYREAPVYLEEDDIAVIRW
jgi:hypothetical protein